MANTPNKLYPLQTTGTNVGTWGTVLNNGALSVIDQNLGGTLNISVAGNSNINLTSAQAQPLIHNLTGVLTGNINYIFPALGGFYAINNQTTGNFTVTVTVVGGGAGITVNQGTVLTIYIDATVPQVESLAGTQYSFIGGIVTGTANDPIISMTSPPGFSLNSGTFITFTPTLGNTGASTLTTPDGSTFPIQKATYSGLAPLVKGDLAPGLAVLAQFTGSVWYALNIIPVGYLTSVSTDQSVTFANLLTNYVNTGAVTYTVAQTTTLLSYWFVNINALGGDATITPNAADVINVNGASLSAGTSFILPRGSTCQVQTDGNGNLFITSLSPNGMPSGSVIDFAGPTAPSGWLLCYGQAISRSTYAALFAVIGTVWGVGDGTTTFNVPDYRGRAGAGVDNMGGSAANRITNAISGITGTTLGASGGNQSMQSHTHVASVTDPGHTHTMQTAINSGTSVSPGSKVPESPESDHTFTTDTGTTGISVTNASTGSGSSQNVQPTLMINKIIKI